MGLLGGQRPMGRLFEEPCGVRLGDSSGKAAGRRSAAFLGLMGLTDAPDRPVTTLPTANHQAQRIPRP